MLGALIFLPLNLEKTVLNLNQTINDLSINQTINQSTNFPNLYFGNGSNGYGNYSGNRPLVSNKKTDVTVCDSGCNFSLINDATKQIPFFLFHKYSIYVQAPYTAYENVYIPPSIVASDMAPNDIGCCGVFLTGNQNDYNEIEVQSIHVLSNIGAVHG